MSLFQTYFQLGLEHIADLNGYDHILFIIALCAVYRLAQWKEVLILVTAFTIGHSVTLALAALNVLVFPPDVIEFLIPVTIIATAIVNVLPKRTRDRKVQGNYWLALFFGFIHGLGFSNFFRSMLMEGESLVQPLLAFNVGVEVGQLFIVAIVLSVAYFVMNILKVQQRDWTIFISGAAAGIAFILMLDAKFW